MIAAWPEDHEEHRDPGAEAQFAFVEAVVSEVRRFRKAHGLRDQVSVAVRIHATGDQRRVLEELRREIQRLASVSTLEVLSEPGDAAGCATLVVDGAQMLIPLAGLFDPEVERARLARRIEEVDAEAVRRSAKLAGEGFLAKAPPAVVDKERERLAALKEESAALAAQLDELGPAAR
jgi:valyl-tRNA synthetase